MAFNAQQSSQPLSIKGRRERGRRRGCGEKGGGGKEREVERERESGKEGGGGVTDRGQRRETEKV